MTKVEMEVAEKAPRMVSLNDSAWDRYFAATGALDEIERSGFCYVTADDLKSVANREPRLMAKIDTNAERPQIFKTKGINILPVQNGKYILFSDPNNRSYFFFDDILESATIEEFSSVVDLVSLDSFPTTGLFSESQAIDYAFTASLLQHFFGCIRMHLCIRGRQYTDSFDLTLPQLNATVSVSRVQVEVDSGYETEDSIFLIEAKIGKRDDFNIRQLVYPYAHWKLKSKKKIRPIFLTYSNGKYVLTEFSVGNDYGEIEVVANRAFTINDSNVAVVNVAELLATVEQQAEPLNVPFPQANDLDKIVDVTQFISRDAIPTTKIDIAEFFEFDERQAEYYANAAAYLGFVERTDHRFSLTSEGIEFIKLKMATQRSKALLRQMLKRPSLRACLMLLVGRKLDLASVSDSEFAQTIQQWHGLAPATQLRRASTVRKWFRWLLKNCDLQLSI